MLNDRTEENQLRKLPSQLGVNLSNPRPGSWDYNNPIENKLKQIIKFNNHNPSHKMTITF